MVAARTASLDPSWLLGSWSLVSFVRRIEGEPIGDVLGPSPIGMISYQPDGQMTAILCQRARTWDPAAHFLDASLDARGRAASEFVAYGGAYDVEGDHVIHHVRVALWPERVGRDLVRRVSWADGDLILTTQSLPTRSGRSMDDQLRWRRHDGRPDGPPAAPLPRAGQGQS
jgi:Lipocalin-like domain